MSRLTNAEMPSTLTKKRRENDYKPSKMTQIYLIHYSDNILNNKDTSVLQKCLWKDFSVSPRRLQSPNTQTLPMSLSDSSQMRSTSWEATLHQNRQVGFIHSTHRHVQIIVPYSFIRLEIWKETKLCGLKKAPKQIFSFCSVAEIRLPTTVLFWMLLWV